MARVAGLGLGLTQPLSGPVSPFDPAQNQARSLRKQGVGCLA